MNFAVKYKFLSCTQISRDVDSNKIVVAFRSLKKCNLNIRFKINDKNIFFLIPDKTSCDTRILGIYTAQLQYNTSCHYICAIVHMYTSCESACGIRQLWSFYKKLSSVCQRAPTRRRKRTFARSLFLPTRAVYCWTRVRALVNFFLFFQTVNLLFPLLYCLDFRCWQNKKKNTFHGEYAVISCRSLTFLVFIAGYITGNFETYFWWSTRDVMYIGNFFCPYYVWYSKLILL